MDPDFGVLRLRDRRWAAETSAGGVSLLFNCGRRAPDAALRKAGLAAIEQLGTMELVARDYLVATATDSKRWPALKLVAVEVLRPEAKWVRNEIAESNPVVAQTILGGTPVVSLEFEITGDRNVVDVIFVNGTPVGWEYH